MRRLEVVPDVAEAAARLIAGRRPRTLVLTGGSTPLPLYRRLATMPLPWHEMELFFGDERCVSPDHPDSNYGRAAETLLDHIAARAVYRMRGEDCDAEGYERDLRARFGPGIPAFDFTLLGLGEDGHVASLFPAAPALEERDRLVLRVPHEDHPRLTLTLPVLSASRMVLFVVTGERKRAALARLMAGADIPAARVAAAEVVVLADALAAS
ncbi:MAG: 6-phosphogluconolactonase [Dehalococcoidia bacterium]|nr:6-phosphogluconolactonase [Dehalococcoidia bacterium]